jgi:hypothetical protein
MTLRVINILENKDYIDPLMESVATIKDQNHHNKNNYENFESRLSEYDAFHVVVDDKDKILAMSGLYNGGVYPSNTIRALDRTYYFYWYEGDSSFNPRIRYNTSYFWPEQCRLAKELGYSSVFFSVQNLKKRGAARDIASRTNPKGELLPLLYNTCRKIDGCTNDDQVCWQNIVLHQFNEDSFDLPSMEIDEYEKRYKNATTIR